jgi:hypothetical protein
MNIAAPQQNKKTDARDGRNVFRACEAVIMGEKSIVLEFQI